MARIYKRGLEPFYFLLPPFSVVPFHTFFFIMAKRVQFSCQVELISTFANEEYDRTAQEVAKLTYHDMFELLTLKSEWRRQMEELRNESPSSDSDEEPPQKQQQASQQQQPISPCDICA
ncbi:hypothetical protein BJV82DRAFT_602693 [Fennellomyces sp. T-0311]|nr:hypothetical protein BJV82DRAFT_602693 [Fennellomyces sp. T-0311]